MKEAVNKKLEKKMERKYSDKKQYRILRHEDINTRNDAQGIVMKRLRECFGNDMSKEPPESIMVYLKKIYEERTDIQWMANNFSIRKMFRAISDVSGRLRLDVRKENSER